MDLNLDFNSTYSKLFFFLNLKNFIVFTTFYYFYDLKIKNFKLKFKLKICKKYGKNIKIEFVVI